MIPTEDVQGQVAVAVEVPMKEPPLLVTVQRIVGGIHIQHDPLGSPAGTVQESIHQQRVHRLLPVVDPLVLLILQPSGPKGFQAVHCALAGQGSTAVPAMPSVVSGSIKLAAHRGQQRIMAQFIMVVGVFIAQADPEHPLAHHFPDRMLYVAWIALVHEAPCKPFQEPSCRLNLTQQQRPGVGADRAAIEGCYHIARFARSQALKVKLFRITICFHTRPFSLGIGCLW
jgi:hypothetical protein